MRGAFLALIACLGACTSGESGASSDAPEAAGVPAAWAPTAPRLHHTHLNTVDADAALGWFQTVWPSGASGTLGGYPAFLTELPVLFTEVDVPPAGAWDPEARRAEPQSAFWHLGAFVNTTGLFEDLSRRGVEVLPLLTGPNDTVGVMRSGQTPYEGVRTAAQLDSLARAVDASEREGSGTGRPGGFGYLRGPDGALVEMTGGPGTTPSFSHVHLYHEQPLCAANWYVEHLGMVLPTRNDPATGDTIPVPRHEDCASAPRGEPGWPSLESAGTIRAPRATVRFEGGSISFYARQCDVGRCGTDAPLAPSRGQVLDHVAFEVDDLDALLTHLGRAEVETEGPYPFGETRAAMIVGPDDLSIELVQSVRVEEIAFADPSGLVVVDAAVKGRAGLPFIVDTGVDPSVIDHAVAAELGIAVGSETAEAAGSGDESGLEIALSSLEALEIGSQRFGDVAAVAADLSSFSTALGVELGGILGYSLLSERVLRIDYRSGTVALAPSAAALPPLRAPVAQTHTVTLEFNSDEDVIPVFTVSIGGRDVPVSLDTGKSGGIELFADATERIRLEGVFLADGDEQRLGARGERTVTGGVWNQVTLGPFTVERIDGSVSDRSAEGERRQGNAGNAFLHDFVVTVDYVARTITFAR